MKREREREKEKEIKKKNKKRHDSPAYRVCTKCTRTCNQYIAYRKTTPN